jgi:hypothetical protein
MRIIDGKLVVELPKNDARAIRIRAILFDQPVAKAPVHVLWDACADAHREVLVAIAKAGEVAQPVLERAVDVDAMELRGRHSGLARLCKRISVEYPIVSVGGRRESRRFSLRHDVAREVMKLAQTTRRRTR